MGVEKWYIIFKKKKSFFLFYGELIWGFSGEMGKSRRKELVVILVVWVGDFNFGGDN